MKKKKLNFLGFPEKIGGKNFEKPTKNFFWTYMKKKKLREPALN